MGCPGLGHHFGFEVASVHCLQVGYDGSIRKVLPEGTDGIQSMRQEEGGSCLQPVHSSAESHGRSFNSLVEIYEIEGNLDSGFVHLQWKL